MTKDEGLKDLLTAVLKQAGDDFDDEYFESKDFEQACYTLGVDPEEIYLGYTRHKQRNGR